MDMMKSILLIYLVLFSTLNCLPTKRQLDNSLTLSTSNWSYDSTNNVYYQIGVPIVQTRRQQPMKL